MRRFCRRCQVEYDAVDNYGTHRCRTHTGTLQRDDRGRYFFTCCPSERRHADYRPRADLGFLYNTSAIAMPPGCTPCDHGEVHKPDGTLQRYPDDITVADWWNEMEELEEARLGRDFTDAERQALCAHLGNQTAELNQLGRIDGDPHDILAKLRRS